MRELIKDLKQLRPLFTQKDVKKFILLFALMICGAFLEAIGIGAIPAFVSLVMQPSKLAELRWVGDWFVGLPDKITLGLLLWASGALLFFVVMKNSFLTFVSYVQARIVASQRVRLAVRLFKIYQSAPYEWHLQRSSSDLIRSLQTDAAQVLNGVVMPILNLIMALIMGSVITAVLIISTPGVTLMALLLTGVGLIAVIRGMQKHLRNIGRTNWTEAKEMVKAIQQGFGSLADARIIGCEEYLSKLYAKSLVRYGVAQRRAQTIQKLTPYAMETFAVLGLLVILLLLVRGSDDLGSVLPIIALLGVVMVRFKQLASQIATSINQVNASRAFIPPIVRDITQLQSIYPRPKNYRFSSGNAIGDFRNLKLDKVSYGYPESQVPAVRDLSLEIKRGESIALVGPTGCGKSTAVNLILGLLRPQSGRITVNDIDIWEDLSGWQANLGYIPQSMFLIDDTIRANVAFGVANNQVDEDKVWNSLRSAGLEKFVKATPSGLNSVVGERGVRLSGGERQRIGIARALYTEPDVLIMDEATSALDNKTEEKVMQAIQNVKQGQTLIMIAHRLTTVVDCDRLYYLSNGQIESQGTYEELRTRSAAFCKMASGAILEP